MFNKKTKIYLIIFIIVALLVSVIYSFYIINKRAIEIGKRFVPEKQNIVIIPLNKIARITCYKTQGIMANGNYTYPGAVAVSDYSIPLNTKIYVEGYGIMSIEDHTASWIQKKRGFTIDIYSPNCSMKFGVKKLTYKLLK